MAKWQDIELDEDYQALSDEGKAEIKDSWLKQFAGSEEFAALPSEEKTVALNKARALLYPDERQQRVLAYLGREHGDNPVALVENSLFWDELPEARREIELRRAAPGLDAAKYEILKNIGAAYARHKTAMAKAREAGGPGTIGPQTPDELRPDPGWMETARKATRAGVARVASVAPTMARMLGNRLGRAESRLAPGTETWTDPEYWDNIAADNRRTGRLASPDLGWGERIGRVDWWISAIGENAPQMAAAIGAHAVGGPAASFAMMAASEAGDHYKGALEEGADENTAALEATAVGLVNGALEMLPLEQLLKTFGREAVKKAKRAAIERVLSVAKDAAKQGTTEGITEALQETTTLFAAQFGHQPDKSVTDWIKQIGTAALEGAAVGVVSGAAGNVVGQVVAADPVRSARGSLASRTAFRSAYGMTGSELGKVGLGSHKARQEWSDNIASGAVNADDARVAVERAKAEGKSAFDVLKEMAELKAEAEAAVAAEQAAAPQVTPQVTPQAPGEQPTPVSVPPEEAPVPEQPPVPVPVEAEAPLPEQPPVVPEQPAPEAPPAGPGEVQLPPQGEAQPGPVEQAAAAIPGMSNEELANVVVDEQFPATLQQLALDELERRKAAAEAAPPTAQEAATPPQKPQEATAPPIPPIGPEASAKPTEGTAGPKKGQRYRYKPESGYRNNDQGIGGTLTGEIAEIKNPLTGKMETHYEAMDQSRRPFRVKPSQIEIIDDEPTDAPPPLPKREPEAPSTAPDPKQDAPSAKPEPGVERDPARIQEIRNSIAEGEMILKSGRTVAGRKMEADELEAVRRSIASARAKLGEAPSPLPKPKPPTPTESDEAPRPPLPNPAKNEKPTSGHDATLSATAPDGTPYTEIYGAEDWSEMTEAQRQAVIDDDAAKMRAQIERDSAENAKQRDEDAEYVRRSEALDAAHDQAERIVLQAGMTVEKSAGRGKESRYITVKYKDGQGGDDTFEVRISDHDQPAGGGFNQNTQSRRGESDVLLDVREGAEVNERKLREEIERRKAPNKPPDAPKPDESKPAPEPTPEQEAPKPEPAHSEDEPAKPEQPKTDGPADAGDAKALEEYDRAVRDIENRRQAATRQVGENIAELQRLKNATRSKAEKARIQKQINLAFEAEDKIGEPFRREFNALRKGPLGEAKRRDEERLAEIYRAEKAERDRKEAEARKIREEAKARERAELEKKAAEQQARQDAEKSKLRATFVNAARSYPKHVMVSLKHIADRVRGNIEDFQDEDSPAWEGAWASALLSEAEKTRLVKFGALAPKTLDVAKAYRPVIMAMARPEAFMGGSVDMEPGEFAPKKVPKPYDKKNIAALGGVVREAVKPFVGERLRYALNGVLVEPGRVVATDGKRMIEVKGETGVTKPVILDSVDAEVEGQFPNIDRILYEPGYEPLGVIDVGSEYARTRPGVMPPSVMADTTEVLLPDGSYQSLEFYRETIEAAYKLGVPTLNVMSGKLGSGNVAKKFVSPDGSVRILVMPIDDIVESHRYTADVRPAKSPLPKAKKPAGGSDTLAMGNESTGSAAPGTASRATTGPVRPMSGPPAGPLPRHRLSHEEITAWVSRTFKVPVLYGGVKNKLTLAFYKVFAQLIRQRGDRWGHVGVLSHEVAHHMDKTMDIVKSIPKPLRAEVGALDYDPSRGSVTEGFAEFMRHYVVERDSDTVAPQFHAHFEAWLNARPDLKAKIEKFRKYVDIYYGQGALERAKANMLDAGKAPPDGRSLWENIKDWLDDALVYMYTAWKDQLFAIGKATHEGILAGSKVKPGASAIEIAEALNQAGPALAKEAILHGNFTLGEEVMLRLGDDPVSGKKGKGLKEIIHTIRRDEMEDWLAMLWARAAQEAWMYEIDPGMTREDAHFIMSEFKAKPADVQKRWLQAAEDVTDFCNEQIDLLARVGLLSPKGAVEMKKKWRRYIPLMRAGALKQRGVGGGKSLLDMPSVIKSRTGSSAAIVNPIQAIIERTVRIYTMASQQLVIRALRDMAVQGTQSSVTGMGKFMTLVSPKQQQTKLSVEEMIKKMEEAGLDMAATWGSLDQNDLETMLSFYRPDWYNTAGKQMGRIWVDGKFEMWEITDNRLWKALKGMEFFAMHPLFEKTFGAAMRMVKLGATGLSPNFAVSNPFRDAPTFAFQSQASAKDMLTQPVEALGRVAAASVNAIIHGESGDPYLDWMTAMGVSQSTMTLEGRAEIVEAATEMFARSALDKTVSLAAHPIRTAGKAIDAVRNTIGATELVPRLAEFMSVLKAHGWTAERLKNGEIPPFRVLVLAANAASDVTTNFRRMGSAGRVANKIIPFFNANLEGLDKFIRTWKDNPFRAAAHAAVLAAASALYWWQVKDDDWYKRSESWLKYGYWVITGKDGTPLFRIPRSYGPGWLIMSLTESVLDSIYRKNPESFADYGKAALRASIIPPVDMVGVAPAIETAFNYDMFRGRKIVPESLERLTPDKQYHRYTLESSKAAANALAQVLGWKVSPAKLEFLANRMTGGGYRRFGGYAEMLAGNRGAEAADMPGLGAVIVRRDYNKDVSEFYEAHTHAEQIYNSARKDISDAMPGADNEQIRNAVDPVIRARYSKLNDWRKLMGELGDAAAQRKGGRDDEFEVERYMSGLAALALGKEPLKRYPDPFRDTNAPADVKKIVDGYLQNVVQRLSPGAEKSKTESWTAFAERRKAHDMQNGETKALLKEMGIGRDRAKALLKAEAKSRGLPTAIVKDGKLTSYGERMKLLNSLPK